MRCGGFFFVGDEKAPVIMRPHECKNACVVSGHTRREFVRHDETTPKSKLSRRERENRLGEIVKRGFVGVENLANF